MLDRRIQFLAFIIPKHWRRTHVPTQTHQLIRQQANALLVCQHLLQIFLGQHTTALDPKPYTTSNTPIHSETTLPGLRQQQLIHGSPKYSLTTQTAHKSTITIPQQMLNPLDNTNLARTIWIMQISNSHRKIKRVSLNIPACVYDTYRFSSFAWPPIHKIFCQTLRLLILVCSIHRFLHTSTLFDARPELLNYAKFVQQFFTQIFPTLQAQHFLTQLFFQPTL